MNSWNWSTSRIPSREAFYASFYFDTELEYVPLPSLLAEAEGAEVEPEALALIVRYATGALRDALSLLEQVSTGGPVTVSLVREALERMVTLEEGETIAWWQLNLETGETIGVGEDGTHMTLVTGAFWIAAYVVIVMEIAFLFQVMLARIIAFAMAAIGTWDYFWREAVGNVPPFKPSGERKTLPQIYQEALEETKSYMHNTAWETFRETCEEFREAGVFALDHPVICYLTW